MMELSHSAPAVGAVAFLIFSTLLGQAAFARRTNCQPISLMLIINRIDWTFLGPQFKNSEPDRVSPKLSQLL